MKTAVLLPLLLLLLISVNSFAFTCKQMDPVLITTSSAWLKNVSGDDCGTLANNEQRYFLFAFENRNRLLFMLLSALMLDTTVEVTGNKDSATGSIIIDIGVPQIVEEIAEEEPDPMVDSSPEGHLP